MMKIKGFFKDLSGYFKIVKMRKKAIKKADDHIDHVDNVLTSQKKLHQGVIKSKVLKIKKS